MSNLPPPDPLPAGAVLADDLVELRLLPVLHPGDTPARTQDTQFLSPTPEYRFAIHLRADGQDVGLIRLRATNDPLIVSTLGHASYDVNDVHRKNGYATSALRLIVGLARLCGVTPLWLLIDPSNDPSLRTAERAGFTFVEIVDTPPEAHSLRPGLGPQLRRYTIR